MQRLIYLLLSHPIFLDLGSSHHCGCCVDSHILTLPRFLSHWHLSVRPESINLFSLDGVEGYISSSPHSPHSTPYLHTVRLPSPSTYNTCTVYRKYGPFPITDRKRKKGFSAFFRCSFAAQTTLLTTPSLSLPQTFFPLRRPLSDSFQNNLFLSLLHLRLFILLLLYISIYYLLAGSSPVHRPVWIDSLSTSDPLVPPTGYCSDLLDHHPRTVPLTRSLTPASTLALPS